MLNVGRESESAERTGGGGAIVERELDDLLAVFEIADDAVFGVDGSGGIGDFDGHGLGFDVQVGIDAKNLARVELRGSGLEISEASGLDEK